jgi:hypothetical protein
MTLKIAKADVPRRAEKKAITHPNRTNGLGCRPSPEKKHNSPFSIQCFFSDRFILQAQGRLFENGMRGGISTITHRYTKVNNEFHPDDFDDHSDKSYLMYRDCNNMYGTALADCLPTGGFRFLFDWELDIFDVKQISDDFIKGYFIECDLEYPTELHDSHNDYPLAPERLTVTADMLSPFCSSFSKKHILSEKLIPNLRDNKNYVLTLLQSETLSRF